MKVFLIPEDLKEYLIQVIATSIPAKPWSEVQGILQRLSKLEEFKQKEEQSSQN